MFHQHKNHMKPIKAIFIFLAIITMSCSKKDNEPQPDQSLEDAARNFSQNTVQIQEPEGLKNSSDTYAQLANSYIQTANSLSNYSALFQIPSGATKTSTPIVASGGRVAKTNTEYLIYQWESQGTGVAYQIHADGNKYIYEYFIKTTAQDGWQKYLYAETQKDQIKALFTICNYLDGTILLNYDWQVVGTQFTMNVSSPSVSSLTVLNMDTDTGAGTVSTFSDNVKIYDMTWDNLGNGSWVYYNSDGSTLLSGDWTA